MSDFNVTKAQIDEIIAGLEQLEADVTETYQRLHAAGFSEDEQVPAE